MQVEGEQGEARRLLGEARVARARGDAATAKTKLRAAADAAKRERAPLVRGAALEGLGELAAIERDVLRGRAHWDAARDAYQEAGDPAGVARAVEGAAHARGLAGDNKGAAELYAKAEELHRQSGDGAAAQRCHSLARELGGSVRGPAPERSDARTTAFLDLLRDATQRLADPRGAASEDAILVALKGAIALTGAERGFVASVRTAGAEPSFVAGLDAKGQRLQGADFRPSFTVVKSVLGSGRSFMSNDLKEHDSVLSNASSVNELGLRAALCAPLAAAPGATEAESAAGVLYVDARASREYTQEDLRFFENVANCVAALYRSARLRDELAASHARIAELNKKLEEKVERQGQELEKTRADLERAREEL
jgi:GAF domain-containing protein